MIQNNSLVIYKNSIALVTGSDFNGNFQISSGSFIVEPSKIPETKEEAILSIKALVLYSSDGSKPFLNVQNSREYFERIITLINS